MPDHPPRPWSVISIETFRQYVKDSIRVIDWVTENRIPHFAAALAGVGFIRTALTVMGGAPGWWARLLAIPEREMADYLMSGGAGTPGLSSDAVTPPTGWFQTPDDFRWHFVRAGRLVAADELTPEEEATRPVKH